MIPLAESTDDIPEFVMSPPRVIGDETIIYAEGKFRRVILLKSDGHVKNGLYLVDLGPVYR